MMTGDIVRRRKLYEEVEARIEEDILRGRLKEGDTLPSEREMMERFGVGRPAVREAIFSLKKKGLVDVRNGERTRVVRMRPSAVLEELGAAARRYVAQPDGLKALHELRTFLEIGLAREAARRATRDDIRMLKARLQANEAAADDPSEFGRTDRDFHLTLAEISGNPLFAEIHRVIVEWLQGQQDVVLEARETVETSLKWHREIVDAIVQASPDRAEAAIRASLHNVDETYWQRVQAKQTAGGPKPVE